VHVDGAAPAARRVSIGSVPESLRVTLSDVRVERVALAPRVRRAHFQGAALVLGAAALVVLTREWGLALERRGVVLLLGHAEPLMGPVRVRLNAETVRLIAVAAAAVVWLPNCCQRLAWRQLLAFSALGAGAWSVALAAVDGWQGGFVAKLTGKDEYLHDLYLVHGNVLRVFTGGIQGHDGLKWTTHVAGHPPGALLTFWSLARIGLSGAGPAAVFCVLTGALAIPAVLVTVRSVAGERLARRAAPFLVVAPAAIWVAVSADAWFLCVSAWGIAALAVAARRQDRIGDIQAIAGGLLLGLALYLSYGLVLLAPVAVGVVAVRHRVRPLFLGLVGVSCVIAVFTIAGFWWFSGVAQTKARVTSGDAGARPYTYFLIANIAALAIAAGPAAVAAMAYLRRARGLPRVGLLLWLPLTALLGLATADLAGISRGEVERIWLPFMPWLIVATALLPARQARFWLAAQLAVAIFVQTVVVSLW